MAHEMKNSSWALVALAWLLVGIPLGWGVYRSGLNAVKLLQPPPSAAPATHAAVSLFVIPIVGYLGMPRREPTKAK